MKTYLFSFAAALFLLGILSGCSESDSVTGPEDGAEDHSALYPISEGNRLVYDIDTVSNGQSYNAGQRIVRFTGTAAIEGTPYFVQRDSLIDDSGVVEVASNIRSTENGVYLYVNTVALEEAIPDSVAQFVTIDEEAIVLSVPLEDGRTWPVFKATVLILSVIDASASYAGSESVSLTLNGTSDNFTAEKVDYRMQIEIPELSGLPAFSGDFSMSVWYVRGIGPVRFLGDETLLTLFTGGEIDLEGSPVDAQVDMILTGKNF